MYKLIAATLAALYTVLLIMGDTDRRPAEVARAEPLGVSLVEMTTLSNAPDHKAFFVSDVSDSEAIAQAIAAGEAHRANRKAQTAARLTANPVPQAPTTDVAFTEATPSPSDWIVTGSRVNLRGGPGTSNAVIGQVTFGTQAEVLSDRDGWFEIRLADGSASGWIFGAFLDQQRPG